MNYTAYYVVRVREDRWAQMQEVLLDDSILFEEPTIWSQIVGGRTVKVPKDWLREMKLVYLAELHEEYLTTTPTSEEQSVFQSRLRALLGPLPWSTDTFDSWWDAQAVDFECAVEDVHRRVSEATLEAIPGLRTVRVRSASDPSDARTRRGRRGRRWPLRSTSWSPRTGRRIEHSATTSLLEAQLRDAAPPRISWMTLLARVVRIEISACARCSGSIKVTRF